MWVVGVPSNVVLAEVFVGGRLFDEEAHLRGNIDGSLGREVETSQLLAHASQNLQGALIAHFRQRWVGIWKRRESHMNSRSIVHNIVKLML